MRNKPTDCDPILVDKLPNVPWWLEDNDEFAQFVHDNPEVWSVAVHIVDAKKPFRFRERVDNLIDLEQPVSCPGCGTVFTTYTVGYEDACPFCKAQLDVGGMNVSD